MKKDIQEEYQMAREVKNIITSLLQVKEKDLPEYFSLRDELKKEFGLEFYDKWFKDALEIDWKVS